MTPLQVIPQFLTAQDATLIRWTTAKRGDQFEKGRQNTGYDKLDVKTLPEFEDLIRRSLDVHGYAKEANYWDAWILRYVEGASIPAHRDEAEIFNMRHHRLNAVALEPNLGGKLFLDTQPYPMPVGWALIFTPDEIVHAVSEVTDGIRLVWSVGCWKSKDSD